MPYCISVTPGVDSTNIPLVLLAIGSSLSGMDCKALDARFEALGASQTECQNLNGASCNHAF